MTGGGGSLDDDAIADVMDFYARAELDGILVLGTTGEGMLLSVEERRHAADAFIAAAHHRLSVIVHCGAQTTRDTVVLAEDAATRGAAGVAVIPPPYFALDANSIWRHLDAAADACAPLPFYVYEFAARSGYSVPIEVIERLRTSAPNLTGLKVSELIVRRAQAVSPSWARRVRRRRRIDRAGDGAWRGRLGLRTGGSVARADHRRGHDAILRSQ